MSIPEWANWLARDNDGELYAHRTEPWKNQFCEWENEEDKYFSVSNYEEDTDGTYAHIKWTDVNPTPVVRVSRTVSKMESVGADVSKMGNNTDCIRPEHYKGEIDRMTVWEQSYSEEECRGAYKAVIDRYVSRYDRKGGIEDLYKAQECLRRLIEWEESK